MERLTATIEQLSRQDGWYAGKVRFSSGRTAEFFVSPSAREVRLYSGQKGGNRYLGSARSALLVALGLEAAPPLAAPSKPSSPARPVPSVPMSEIARMVARANKVTVADLKSGRRSRAFVKPRQAAMWLMLWSGKSTTQVGAYLGGRHHTTVMHGRDAHQQRLDGGASLDR